MRTSRVWMWIHGATMCVLAPWVEEIFFRGFLHHAFRQRGGWFLAALGQSLVFVGLHHRYRPESLVVVFVAGLALLAVYRLRRTLLSPIIIHTAFNAIILAGMVSEAQRPQPWLGVSGDPKATDCRLSEVVAGSPAAKAGLKTDDVVISFNGEPVDLCPALRVAIQKCSVGDRVEIEWRRKGKNHTWRATLGERRIV